MGTLEIGAENAPGDGVAVTAANGGGMQGGGGVFSTSAKRQGLYGYRFNSTTLPANVLTLFENLTNQAASTTNTIRTRIYFRISALPGSGFYGNIFSIRRNSNTDDLAWIQIQSNGTLVVRDQQDAGLFVSSLVIQPNVWYRMELNLAPSNANAANSRLLFWCGPANTNPTTVNTSTEAYFYTTTFNAWGVSTITTAPGIGQVNIGKISNVSYPAIFEYDDLAFDNGAWTNASNTWWGKATNIVSDVWSASGTPAVAIAGSAIRVVSDAPDLRATAGLLVSAAPVQKSAILPVRGIPTMALAPSVSRSYALAAAALAALALGSNVSRNYVLPVRGIPTLTVNKGPSQISAALALAAAAALADGGIRGTTSDLSMGATASALYDPKIDVLSALGMSARPTMEVAIDVLWQGFFFVDAVSALDLGSLRVALPGLAVRATPALALAPLIVQSRVLAVRGVPVLIVAGRKDTAGALKVAAVPRVVFGGVQLMTALLSLKAKGTMIHFGATIGEVRTYDEVVSHILSQGGAARLFEAGLLAELLDNGMRLADVLGGPFTAVPLPGGMLAVIQD